MKRILMTLTFALAFMFVASAQKASIHEIEYESFTSVKVSDDPDITK